MRAESVDKSDARQESQWRDLPSLARDDSQVMSLFATPWNFASTTASFVAAAPFTRLAVVERATIVSMI